jgi:hypothetical protein
MVTLRGCVGAGGPGVTGRRRGVVVIDAADGRRRADTGRGFDAAAKAFIAGGGDNGHLLVDKALDEERMVGGVTFRDR